VKKDEFQWMSLALVGDRKYIRLQKNSAPVTLSGIYFPLRSSEEDMIG